MAGRVAGSCDGAYLWTPDLWHVQECIEELSLDGCKAPSTPGTKDSLSKQFGVAEVGPQDVMTHALKNQVRLQKIDLDDFYSFSE